jgi:hypothetical protein
MKEITMVNFESVRIINFGTNSFRAIDKGKVIPIEGVEALRFARS